MKKLVLTLIIFVSFNSWADFLTSERLFDLYRSYQRVESKKYNEVDYRKAYEFMGYVTGFMDGLDGKVFCAGNTVTRGHIADVVSQYMDTHPELKDKSSSQIVYQAFSEAFPCKTK